MTTVLVPTTIITPSSSTTRTSTATSPCYYAYPEPVRKNEWYDSENEGINENDNTSIEQVPVQEVSWRNRSCCLSLYDSCKINDNNNDNISSSDIDHHKHDDANKVLFTTVFDDDDIEVAKNRRAVVETINIVSCCCRDHDDDDDDSVCCSSVAMLCYDDANNNCQDRYCTAEALEVVDDHNGDGDDDSTGGIWSTCSSLTVHSRNSSKTIIVVHRPMIRLEDDKNKTADYDHTNDNYNNINNNNNKSNYESHSKNRPPRLPERRNSLLMVLYY